MKRFALFLLAIVTALGFASCNDTDGDYPAVLSFVTVQTSEADASAYYFVRDDGTTLYPGDKSRIPGYSPEQDARAVIYYNLLQTPAAGYSHNIAPYAVSDVRIGHTSIVTTQEELDALGHAKTDFDPSYCQLTERFFNLRIGYFASLPAQHTFALIRNDVPDTASGQTESGYLRLELRHNAGNDPAGYFRRDWISFPVDPFREALEGVKGVLIRVETVGYGTQYIRLELPEKGL